MGGRICYLHIGAGKTGSSAIQYALTCAHDELLGRGYLYPDAAGNFRQVLAGMPTAGNAWRINAALMESGARGALELVKKHSEDPRHLVLSCEGLSNQRSDKLEEFHIGLQEMGYEPRYLVFFRPQAENIVASYLQQTKVNKINVSLNEYLDLQFRSQQINRRWDWYARAQKLETAVGYDNLTVKWYPAVTRAGQNALIKAVFDWLGIGPLDHPKDETPVINATPGREALIVLRAVTASGLRVARFGNRFLRAAQKEGLLGAKVALEDAAFWKVQEATFKDNERLLRRYCPDLVPEAELELTPERSETTLDQDTLQKLQALAKNILVRKVPAEQHSKIQSLFSPAQNGKRAETRIAATRRAPVNTRPATSRCIIHIGMHKTGSTSIQKSLDRFEDEQFVYADLGGFGNHSLPIYSLFSGRPEQHHLHRSRGRDAAAARAFNDEVKANLEQAIEQARGRTLIISGEDIGVLLPADVDKMRDYFRAHFDEVSIVSYVRPPAGLMASRFQQLVKGGTMRSIDMQRIYRNYQSAFAKFDASFGQDNVKLWKFDPKAFPEGDVVQDFCARLGISIPKDRIVRMNESLSRQAISLLYTYNKCGQRDELKKLRAPEAMRLGQLISGDKFRFSPDLVRSVLEDNRADIEWMEKRLGQSLQEEIGSRQSGDVADEADLLRPDPEAVSKLVALLGRHLPAGVRGETTEDVAKLVEAWRATLPAGKRRWKGRPDMADFLSRRKRGRRADVNSSGVAKALSRFRGLFRRRTANGPLDSSVPAGMRNGTPLASNQSPYENRAKSQFWRTGAAETDPLSIQDLYKRKFEITKSTRVATAGSCFAQHIGRRLQRRGFKILDLEPAPPMMAAESAMQYGYGIYSGRYGNIYLMRQLLQLTQEALAKWKPQDIVWSKGGKFFDALRPGVEPQGLDSADEVLAHRKSHLAAVRQLLSDTELFVFTFGLTEGWVHRPSQTVYPTAPGTIAGSFDPAVHEFKNFTFSEIMTDFLAFRALVRSVNPGIRFLLTVSPVPLTATASDDHVLAATTYSKAVLRAVAGQLHKEFDDVDYFPSFELIASHWSKGAFFEPNLRSVAAEGVDAVMRIFFAAHDPEGQEDARPAQKREISEEDRLRRKKRRMGRAGKKREEEVCEEAMLEAFNR